MSRTIELLPAQKVHAGAMIRAFAEAKGMTLPQLALLWHYPNQRLTAMVNGRQMFVWRIAEDIAEKMGISFEDLVGPEDEPLTDIQENPTPGESHLYPSSRQEIGELLAAAQQFLEQIKNCLLGTALLDGSQDVTSWVSTDMSSPLHSNGLHSETPLDTIHRYWRQVSPEDRARFLIEMLTPAERRLIMHGLMEEEPSTDA
jgi:hypothetical protein